MCRSPRSRPRLHGSGGRAHQQSARQHHVAPRVGRRRHSIARPHCSSTPAHRCDSMDPCRAAAAHSPGTPRAPFASGAPQVLRRDPGIERRGGRPARGVPRPGQSRELTGDDPSESRLGAASTNIKLTRARRICSNLYTCTSVEYALTVLKTVGAGQPRSRGFESHALRPPPVRAWQAARPGRT